MWTIQWFVFAYTVSNWLNVFLVVTTAEYYLSTLSLLPLLQKVVFKQMLATMLTVTLRFQDNHLAWLNPADSGVMVMKHLAAAC